MRAVLRWLGIIDTNVPGLSPLKKFGILPNLISPGISYREYMEMTNGLELSPKKVEYLKYLSERSTPVKTSLLAQRFCVDPSTITKTICELAEAGYLTHTPYHGVRLSESGKRHTEFLLKRHRILALMLTHYGLSDEQACAEVSRFESLVSRDAIDRMCHSMGHPQEGICGKITHDDGCRHAESTIEHKKSGAGNRLSG